MSEPRRRSERRLPRDLIALILLLVAAYAGAWIALRFASLPVKTPPAAPPVAAAPAPAPLVLPEPYPAAQAVDPVRRRRAPPLSAPEAETQGELDPFADVERVTSQELDAISQAR